MTTLDPKQEETLRLRFRRGVKLEAIEHELGVGQKTLRLVRETLCLARGHCARWTAAERAILKRLWADKTLSSATIGRMIGGGIPPRTGAAVRQEAGKLGLPRRKGRGYRKGRFHENG